MGIYRSGETLFLEIKGNGTGGVDGGLPRSSTITTLKKQESDICISKSVLDLTPKNLQRTVQQARRGLALGLKPKLVLDGSGGTYFLQDARKAPVAVFKPADEEPYAENNPRGYVRGSVSIDTKGDDDITLRAGVQPGEACLREVAAFLLDHDSFASVPQTTLAEARHPAYHSNGSMLNLNQGGAAVGFHSLRLGSQSLATKNNIPEKKVGSVQEYISAECSMDDWSPSKLSADQVHKIAVLDIRILNADRNSANLLCRRNMKDPDKLDLIPIDHGYCLRTVADICWFDWCWLDWPQMKEPVSQSTKKYVQKLKIEEDAKMLKERFNLAPEALDYFRASNKLLKAGVKAGMTLYDIAVLCCRNDDTETPSTLEKLMTMSKDVASEAIHSNRWHHAAASRALASQLTPLNQGDNMSQSQSGLPNISMMSMVKSASSVNFSSSSFFDRNQKTTQPCMANSSGSDSSSDAEDVEEEECEVWAATVIANHEGSHHYSVSPSRRQRATSIAYSQDSFDDASMDDGMSKSSLGGFWHVPPSASKGDDLREEMSWSPQTTPNVSDFEVESIDLDLPRPTLKISGDIGAMDLSHMLRNTSLGVQDEPDLNLGKAVEVSPTVLTKPKLAMKRSQSYSAFSFQRITDETTASENNIRKGSSTTNPSNDQYRMYFHKFIDLLITREIASRIRSKSNNTACSYGIDELQDIMEDSDHEKKTPIASIFRKF